MFCEEFPHIQKTPTSSIQCIFFIKPRRNAIKTPSEAKHVFECKTRRNPFIDQSTNIEDLLPQYELTTLSSHISATLPYTQLAFHVKRTFRFSARAKEDKTGLSRKTKYSQPNLSTFMMNKENKTPKNPSFAGLGVELKKAGPGPIPLNAAFGFVDEIGRFELGLHETYFGKKTDVAKKMGVSEGKLDKVIKDFETAYLMALCMRCFIYFLL